MSNDNNNYTNIFRPYNGNIERADESITDPFTIGSSDGTQSGNSSEGIGGSAPGAINEPGQIGENAISGQSFDNIYVSNWIKSQNYKPKTQGFLLDGRLGYIECNKLYVGSGGIIGGSLDIPDATSANSWHVDLSGNMWSGCNVADFVADPNNANAYILSTGVAQFQSVTLTGSVIATDFQPGTDIAIQGWSSTVAFVASTYRIVTWSAGGTGTIKILDGTVYTIAAGTTGIMTALTYIYLDINVSTTVLQTSTTYTDAVGKGKILVCVAQNNTDTSSSAQFQAFGGYGGNNLFVDNIAANSASVNEFVSNTAQIKDLIVTNAKINSLSVGKLTAGSILSQEIVLGVTEASGDVFLAGGSYNSTTWTATSGFILGLDDSDSNREKFYIGDATNWMDWNVTTADTLTIAGSLTVGSLGIQNLLDNGSFEDWSAGTAVAPDSWLLSNGSVARSATVKIGTYSAALTRAGVDCAVTEDFYVDKGIAYWQGRTVSFSMWVKASSAGVSIKIQDSVGTTSSADHSGGGGWELITVSKTINGSATWARAGGQIIGTNQTVNFDGAMLVEGLSSVPFSPKYRDWGQAGNYTQIDGGNISVSSSISINDATWGNTGIQLQYNGGTPRMHVGTTVNYMQFDGTKLIATAAAGSANMIVTGGIIHGAFTISGPNDAAGGGAPAIKQIWSGEVTANNDYIYVVWDDSNASGRVTRYNRTKANAIFRDSADTIARAALGGVVYSGAYDGTYIYSRDAANLQFVRKDKDLTNEALSNTAEAAGNDGAEGGTYDGTYHCFSQGGNIKRYTFSGAPWDWVLNDTITLSNNITGSLCWNPINSQWYGYDSGNNLLRSFNSTGTQQSTLTIYEDVVGIMMLEDKLYVCYMSTPGENSAVTNWVINCVPFDF